MSSTTNTVNTIGVLGAGRVGSAIARTAIKAGYTVNIAGSGPASDIELLVDVVVPGARAMSAADAVAAADLVIVAVPLHKFQSVDPITLDGKLVVDTMNYWEPIDGHLVDFAGSPGAGTGSSSSSEVVHRYFSGAQLVRTLNHIGYHELETDPRAAGHLDRRALAIAGESDSAAVVAEVIERFGFDAVISGPLETGAAFEPGTPIFGGWFAAAELRAALKTAPNPAALTETTAAGSTAARTPANTPSNTASSTAAKTPSRSSTSAPDTTTLGQFDARAA